MKIFGWRNTPNSPDGEMGFLDHLEELRWHLFRSIIAVLVAGVLVSLFSDYTFGLLFLDLPFNKDFISNRLLCEQAGGAFCNPSTVDKIYTSPMEGVMTAFTFGAIAGLIVAFPYVIWELWRFIKPALSQREIRTVRWNVWVISCLFFLGIAFGYFVILPFTIKFAETLNFGGVDTKNIWKVNSIVNFILMLVLSSGLIFQIPVLMYYLAKLGIISREFLRKYRRHAVVVLLVTAGMLTPPDPVSIFLLFFPLYFLFEIGVLITNRVERKRKARELAEEAASNTAHSTSV